MAKVLSVFPLLVTVFTCDNYNMAETGDNHIKIPKYAYHKGDTYYGHENSLEAIIGHYTMSKENDANLLANRVYEIDIIAKSPFLVSHDPYAITEDVFKPISSESMALDVFENCKHKYLADLSEVEIRHVVYKSGDAPMILSELLTFIKFMRAKVYLDIKSPLDTCYDFFDPSDTGKLDASADVTALEADIFNMIDVISKTCDELGVIPSAIIDTIISFDDAISVFMKAEIDRRDLDLDNGMFVFQNFQDDTMNRAYLDLLYEMIRPNVISYNHVAMFDKPDYLSRYDGARHYVWTVHIDDLPELREKEPDIMKRIEDMGAIWVVDNFTRDE